MFNLSNLLIRNNQGVFALEENRKRALELLEKWIKEEEERVERSDNESKENDSNSITHDNKE